MNVVLPNLPERPQKPREHGLTMVMDKGLSAAQAEAWADSCHHLVDLVKLGFGTSVITNNLLDKIKIYQQAGIKVYFGGTLFEAFYIRGMIDEFRSYIDKFGISLVEISDGSMAMESAEKLKLIEAFAKDYQVLSEVGSKQKGVIIPPDRWISMMKEELQAGSWKVIAEARESGTVGIYNPDGSANIQLIQYIESQIKDSNILWEAPSGKQQIWFIKTQGPNVNLGNIAPELVIPLETLRLGLRGDTFLDYLPEEIQKERAQLSFASPIIDYQI